MKFIFTKGVTVKIFLLLTLFVVSNTVWGGGFEKVVQWSARYSAIGGAASGIVDGADSVYFNPAGMAFRKNGDHDLSVNITPTLSQFKGPIFNEFQQIGNKKLTTPFGALASHRLFKNFDIGYGLYVGGGTMAEFRSVNFTAIDDNFAGSDPDIRSKLNVIEAAIAASYKFTKNFSFGAAWRAVFVRANFASAKVTYTTAGAALALSSTVIENIRADKHNGFKLGMQYRSDDDDWGLGLVWRTEIDFIAKGDVSGNTVYTATGQGALALQGVTVTAGEPVALVGGERLLHNKFPQQISFGGFYRLFPELTLFGEYTWTQYSVNKNLEIYGNLLNTASGTTTPIPDIRQAWSNQHNLKIGTEWAHSEKLTFRAGYAFTSRVTNHNAARATFSSPGFGHTFIIGEGYAFNNTSYLDGAFEYSFASGKEHTPDESTSATQVTPQIEGKFKSKAYALHLSYRHYF